MNTPSIIFLVFIVFCIGAAVGSLVERALKRRSSPRPPQFPAMNKLAGEGDIEILGAWRTRANKVWLAMDGKRLDNKEALLPEQSQRLLNLVLDLRPWLETARPAAPEPGAAVRTIQPPRNSSVPAAQEIKTAPAPESIIEQIDKVLQSKLVTSVYKDRGIELTEGPGGIVIIKDGENSFEGIDSVPDLQVKTLIQQAVTDWEKGIK
jgi:hypothetical protein